MEEIKTFLESDAAIWVGVILVLCFWEFLATLLALTLTVVMLVVGVLAALFDKVIDLFRKKEDRSKWVWLDGPDAK